MDEGLAREVINRIQKLRKKVAILILSYSSSYAEDINKILILAIMILIAFSIIIDFGS